MKKELDDLIDIYGIEALRDYLYEKSRAAKNADYNRDWNLNCRRYGLKPEDLGARFLIGKEWYVTTGIKTANRKYPLLADRARDGKGFKFPPSSYFASCRVEKPLLDKIREEEAM